MNRLRGWAGRAIPLLLAAGLLALGYAVQTLAATWHYQHDARHEYRHIKEDS